MPRRGHYIFFNSQAACSAELYKLCIQNLTTHTQTHNYRRELGETNVRQGFFLFLGFFLVAFSWVNESCCSRNYKLVLLFFLWIRWWLSSPTLSSSFVVFSKQKSNEVKETRKKSDSGNADLSFACGVSSSIVPAATGVNPLVLLSKLSLCDANAPRYWPLYMCDWKRVGDERERERNKALKCPLLSTSRVVATPLLQARTI